jgi:micrococcal nuclease
VHEHTRTAGRVETVTGARHTGPMTRRAPLLIVAIGLAAVLVALAVVDDGNAGNAGNAEPGAATVVRIVDGDTIVVGIAGGDEHVRLIGIDTPESVDPRRPVECFGKEAAARTAELVPPGSEVRLVRDVEARDRYGRLLAYVYRASDGLFVNLALAEEGYAAVATFPPNVAHVDDFRAAAARARESARGLWRACGR